MKKISGYFLGSIFLFSVFASAKAQDTLDIQLNLRAGIDIFDPVISFINNDISGIEGFAGIDLNEKMAAVIEAGHIKFNYSQYNYAYASKGTFFRAGIDFNSMKTVSAMGKYYAGIGVRYGISFFRQEITEMETTNYWGTIINNVPWSGFSAHFIEVEPGIRSEIFKNFSIGWTISVRMLIHSGTGKDMKPVYLPGFGNSGKTFSQGFNYYLIWNIPYRNKRVIVRPPVIEESAE